MGAETSKPIRRTSSFNTNFPYFFITFRRKGKILVATADPLVISVIRAALTECWTFGLLKDASEEAGYHTFKLKGAPFTVDTPDSNLHEKYIESKRVCNRLLADLLALGWKLTVSSDVTREYSLSTWFFTKVPATETVQKVLCVNISSSNTLQLIDAPESIRIVFQDCVDRIYEFSVEKEESSDNILSFRFKGDPWGANLEDGLLARKLLLEIFRKFDDNGFHFYGTVNLKGHADCVFFISKGQDENKHRGRLPARHMMVSLNLSDRIRMIDCPSQIIDGIREVVKEHWGSIQDESELLEGVRRFQLKGNPWWCEGTDAVKSRILVAKLLEKCLSLGWTVVTSLDVSRSLNDKSVFVFRSSQPRKSEHFCVSLNEANKMRLIGVPFDLSAVIKAVVEEAWSYGVYDDGDYAGSREIRFKGHPWCYDNAEEYMLSRYAMCFVMKTLIEHGYKVVCSADVCAKYGGTHKGLYPADSHTWFINKA